MADQEDDDAAVSESVEDTADENCSREEELVGDDLDPESKGSSSAKEELEEKGTTVGDFSAFENDTPASEEDTGDGTKKKLFEQMKPGLSETVEDDQPTEEKDEDSTLLSSPQHIEDIKFHVSHSATHTVDSPVIVFKESSQEFTQLSRSIPKDAVPSSASDTNSLSSRSSSAEVLASSKASGLPLSENSSNLSMHSPSSQGPAMVSHGNQLVTEIGPVTRKRKVTLDDEGMKNRTLS